MSEEDVESQFRSLKIMPEKEEEIKESEEESEIEEWEQLEEQLDYEPPTNQKRTLPAQDSKSQKNEKGYPRTSLGPPSVSTNSLLLEGFPESFKTGDLVDLFDKIDSAPMIKWINDTSAIAMFPTSNIAKKAYISAIGHPFITISPYTNAITEQNFETARAERPTTTDMVARRLIAGALGVRPKQKSLQERENDWQKLDQARELRAEKKKEIKSRREASDSLFDS